MVPADRRGSYPRAGRRWLSAVGSGDFLNSLSQLVLSSTTWEVSNAERLDIEKALELQDMFHRRTVRARVAAERRFACRVCVLILRSALHQTQIGLTASAARTTVRGAPGCEKFRASVPSRPRRKERVVCSKHQCFGSIAGSGPRRIWANDGTTLAASWAGFALTTPNSRPVPASRGEGTSLQDQVPGFRRRSARLSAHAGHYDECGTDCQ